MNYAVVTIYQMDGWLGFNGILSMQVASILCLKKFEVC